MASTPTLRSRLRHKITVEQPTETIDSNGVVTQTWATYYTCRAAIIPINGREYYEAKQVASDVTTRFRIRYCAMAAAMTNKMRLKYGSDYYDIESIIDPQMKHEEIILMAVLKNA